MMTDPPQPIPGDSPWSTVDRQPTPGLLLSCRRTDRNPPLSFDVEYIGPNESRKLITAGLAGTLLYAQPGGDDSVGQAMKVTGSSQTEAIKDYVRHGGHFAGFCMGAYLAGENPGLGLLSPGEYSATDGALVHGSDEAVIPVNRGSTSRYMYLQDAPYIIPSKVA